jgi:hypothetical protein
VIIWVDGKISGCLALFGKPNTLMNVTIYEIYGGPHNILIQSFLFWLKVAAHIALLAYVGSENQANYLPGKSDSRWLIPDSPICASQ